MTKKTKQHKKYAQRAGQLSEKPLVMANKAYATSQVGLGVQKAQSIAIKPRKANAINTQNQPFWKLKPVMLG
jgi:hypothetical protein